MSNKPLDPHGQLNGVFTAIDVETANANLGSICQVGLATFDETRLVAEWQSLVDPEDYFDGINVSIHGISEQAVIGAPTFSELHGEMARRIAGPVVVSHTAFDRVSLTRASGKYDLPLLGVTWLDSAMVARRAWPEQCAARGYGLRKLAAMLSLEFTPHVAVEDAKVAGWILLRAMRDSGLTLEDWVARVRQPIFSPDEINQNVNLEGSLAGHVIAFTGTLSLVRREAAMLAAAAGCNVQSGVTRDTTLLLVGDQDISRLAAGQDKSNKYRKAELLIRGGQRIRIIGESDFLNLLAVDQAVCPAA